jgi:chemosensory pili system protein ChpA (sensor histidine kinase/response regulator)
VDGIVADSEMVVRALPPYLRRHAVRGAATTPGGEVLLLLDLPELVTRAARLSQSGRRPPPVLRHAPAAVSQVLVVDDSLTMRRALETMLGRAGYAVRTARDGMEALEQMLSDLPDLLVLDVEMPRLDGFELLSVLRAHPEFSNVRVVMLTTRAAEKHRRRAEALGVDAYLVKPCPEDELLAVFQRLRVPA